MPAAAPPDLHRLDRATEGVEGPFAVIDVDAFRANADDLVRRAAGVPIRVASKSVRCRALLEETLSRPGFAGVMAYSLPEAIWLVRSGLPDVLMGYPTVDTEAVAQLSGDPELAAAVTLMVDSPEHLEWLRRNATGGHTIRLCLDVDASLRLGPVHLGVRRSPLRTPQAAAELAAAAGRDRFRVVGLMFYDAQIAGLPDSSAAVRMVKRRSHAELMRRRSAVVAAVRQVADLEIVNGGGTGSLHVTGQDRSLTELAAGSGLFGPTLFDGYRDFTPRQAALFALPVVRRPTPNVVTAFSGGYVASGQPGWSRVPSPVAGQKLRLRKQEGTGEVQTPLVGGAARSLRLGDRVWMRHAKAGEQLERFAAVHLVEGEQVSRVVPSYRGEGKCFG